MQEVEVFSRVWRARIEQSRLASQVIETLWSRRAALAKPVMDRARAESEDIDTVMQSDAADTRAHVLEHFRAILALPAARVRELGEDPMRFVREHGVRRARMGVPLRAVLQAYRTGHKSFWQAMGRIIGQVSESPTVGLDAAMLLSEYCIDYTDLISVIVTDAYVEEEAKLAEERTRLGVWVLEDLLAGAELRTDEAWRLCERSGLTPGRAMSVIVAHPVGQEADRSAAIRARGSLARAIEAALPVDTLGRLVGVRGEEVVAIVAADAIPAESAAARLRLAAGAMAAAAGPFRAGIGLDAASVEGLPRAYDEAMIALDLAVGDQSVLRLADVGVEVYLRRTANETARRLSPALPAEVARGELGRTLRAFAASDLNVKACARALNVHTNTIYHRLNRIRRLTGLDPRSFAGLSDLMTALALSGHTEGGGRQIVNPYNAT
jgi:hypothetical protein